MTVKQQAAELIEMAEAWSNEQLCFWVELRNRIASKDDMKKQYVELCNQFYQTFDQNLDNGKKNLTRSVEAFFYDYNDGLQPKYKTPIGLRDKLEERLLIAAKMEWLDKEIQKQLLQQ